MDFFVLHATFGWKRYFGKLRIGTWSKCGRFVLCFRRRVSANLMRRQIAARKSVLFTLVGGEQTGKVIPFSFPSRLAHVVVATPQLKHNFHRLMSLLVFAVDSIGKQPNDASLNAEFAILIGILKLICQSFDWISQFSWDSIATWITVLLTPTQLSPPNAERIIKPLKRSTALWNLGEKSAKLVH